MNFTDDKNIVKKEISDNFAIVDLSTGGRILSSVCNIKKSSEAYGFDIMSDFEAELNKALFSYESRPILLSDKESFAFVVTGFTASSGMYLTAIPDISPRSVAFAIKNKILGDVFVLGELPEFTRVSKRMKEEAQILKEWLCSLESCFGACNENYSSVFDKLLRDRILNIARYVGVNARIVTVEELSGKENFDFGLFLAFVTVMLMLARVRSRDNFAMISIGEDSHGMFVSIDFSFDGQDPRYDRELLVFKGMADRKRVLFEAIEKDEVISVKCSPIIEDWSLLEVKVPDNEEMEFELT
jgi:hypothetical protein